MGVIYGIDDVPVEPRGRAVAVGVFDGVHWGHRAIFGELLSTAGLAGLEPVALTFDKHPAEVLAPNRAPLYINTLDQRVELINAAGVETVIVAEFSHELANISREDFLKSILRDKLQVRHIVVGSNFRFVRDREGDVRYLAEAGPPLGISITHVAAVIVNEGPVSSTRIRAMIGRGDVENASKLLGRRFALRGEVVMGRQVGRTIGFPTANIRTAPRQLIPARGVYAVEVIIGRTAYPGVCNIGHRPTFDSGALTVEVHLAGFEGNIYGQRLDVIFCRRLRDEMVFESPESLAEQIRRDLDHALGSCPRALSD